MKQMEASKKEYIDKLKAELDIVEEKWILINNENCMVGEDYRSQTIQRQEKIQFLNQIVDRHEQTLIVKIAQIEELTTNLANEKKAHENS